MSEKQQCCARVYASGAWRSSQCSKASKVVRDGMPYCTIHDPVRVKEKSDARSAKWNSEWAAKSEEMKRQRVCVNACKGIPTAELEAGVLGDMREALVWLLNVEPNHNDVYYSDLSDRVRAIISRLPGEAP